MSTEGGGPMRDSCVSWLSEKVVATVLGLSVYTLRSHRHKGIGLPYVKYGKSVRYSSADIAAYLESRKINHSRV